MLPGSLPGFCLEAWPELVPLMQLHEAIPTWPVWSAADEANLQWTVEEQAKFEDPAYGSDPRRFVMNGQAATAVHSAGNVLSPCPCGCRPHAFSDQRLRHGGIRGTGVASQTSGSIRHPHPAELGLMNSVPPKCVFVQPARSALCLIGHVAAPLQVVWIVAQVQAWIDEHLTAVPVVHPLTHLAGFKHMLLQQRRDTWITPAMLQPRCLQVSSQGVQFSIAVQAPVRAGDICEAECRLSGEQLQICVCFKERILDAQDLLHAACR